MTFHMLCVFLLGMLHAEHVTADSNGAVKIGKAMSKFMPVGHMPRLVGQDTAATPESDLSVQRAMLKTLADMEVRNQEMQAEYQSLRARIQKMPLVDVQASFGSGASFSWLAGCYAFVGMATSIGVAAVKFSGRGEHGSAVPNTSRTSTIRMQIIRMTPEAELSAGIVGLVVQPIMWWSLFALKTTGCGLPAGPFGLLGLSEGISYLVVIGLVGAALINKFTSGKGLPSGPYNLLGLAEGLSFLTALAGLGVLGFQLLDYGYLPEAVPIEGGVCSNIG